MKQTLALERGVKKLKRVKQLKRMQENFLETLIKFSSC